ncbi:MurR/RpiR family transcriptional regulator [Solibacillus isronensis]|uniref:MurR/RpiR family transcriptional regulator n=1 Tax=Solibacillus isronensis TaxID=412383 RepID=UPI00203C4136|nr:MurR/RpiR family transcriptional regulator [Solibacillus isronensis]MCM3723772.1 MurR/RpiR family transcriptional regulator [Solibacillus isronensis]
MENLTICENIKKKYIRLSKGQRKVAQFVMDNPNIVGTHTASEVGRLADVSESTVIRFCYSMDLAGFSELQDKLKEYLMDKGEVTEVKQAMPVKKIRNHIGADIVKKDIANISKTFNQLKEQDVEEVVQLLHTSKKIHFLGFRQSTPVAFWMYSNVNRLRDHVHFIPHEADKIAQQLAYMDEDSLLFVISLDEEYEDMATTVEIAKRKNVKIVAIRNKELTSQEPANPVLIVPNTKEAGATCTIAIFSLLHILVESMVSQNPQQYEQYNKKTNGALNTPNLIAIS